MDAETLQPENIRDAIRRLFAKELADGFKVAGAHRCNDAEGRELFRMVRLKHPAKPKVMKPVHRAGLRYTMTRGERPAAGWPLYVPPYPLVQADPLFIAEGEACADALGKLGVPATTSGGASSADAADWQPLRGRVCVMWPDNDGPGAKYAADVVRHLRALGCDVRVIAREIVEALPEGGDVVDWLAAHPNATADEVRAPPTVPAPVDVAPGDDWAEPTPLPDGLPPVQAFDADLLPEGLRGWVADIAERMQCPPDFPAVGALVSLSALVGARAVMAPKEHDDWRVVPNLWGLIVGRPGVMKSPALEEAKRPLVRLEAAERKRWQTEHDDWQRDCVLAELNAKPQAKKAAAFAKKDPAKARELLRQADPKAEPVMRRYAVNDATQEKLADLLTVNPWGFLVYRDELHGLLRALDKPGQEGSRGFYLTAYDGNQGYAVDRIGRGESYVPRVCFALLGSMQPGKVQQYVRAAVTGGESDDGLLQRFGLAVWPDVSRDWRRVDHWPDTPARQAANAVFDRLDKLDKPDTPGDEARALRFTAEAQGLYWQWAEPFERELRGDGLHPALVSHLAKYRKLVPALALLFALVDTPDAGAVGKPELLRALAWGDYLRTHAARPYAAAVTPETAGAAILLARLRAGALIGGDGKLLDAFTPRLIAVKHWTGLTTPGDVRKAADLLTDYGWLARDDVPTGPTGGRPSECYVLHPCLRAGSAS